MLRDIIGTFYLLWEKGWIIDSGASAHMTPFKKDCTNIQPAYKLIYLADGSS